jgi:hypothetical protein
MFLIVLDPPISTVCRTTRLIISIISASQADCLADISMFHTGHTQQHLARAIPQAISGGGSSFVTAASSICRVELVAICTCAIASQGPFTHGTGELFSSRRLASRGRRASHGYYLPVACEHARIRSPRCGVCMLYLWAISGIGSSFGAAVSCICQLSAVQQGGKRNYAIWQASRWIRRPAPCAVRVTGTDLIFAHIQLSVALHADLFSSNARSMHRTSFQGS